MSDFDSETVRAIEAIVMVAVEPVAPDLLAQLLEQPTTVIERLCIELAAAYDEAGHGFQLVKVAGGYRYQSHAELAPYVERFLLDGQRARMSAAALETLAIVAYKQPLSRGQIPRSGAWIPMACCALCRPVATSPRWPAMPGRVRRSCTAPRHRSSKSSA